MDAARLLILDDEMIIARDLERIIKKMDLKNVTIANSSTEFEKLYLKIKPHLVLCDINLEEADEDGISLCQKMRKKLQTQIIFITAYSNPDFLKRAGLVKPLNYLLKPFDEKQVIASIKMAISKPEVLQGGFLKTNYATFFTKQEYYILKLIANNKTTEQIAKILFISPRTVEKHRSNITQKLQLEHRNNSLLCWAIAHKKEL